MADILFKEECYRIQGAIYEVHREMGHGYVENVYQECLEKEFRLQQIPFVPQQPLKLFYKGEPLEQSFRPDLICFDEIIVELKAVKDLVPEHHAQVLNYLKATGKRVGLLVNFGAYPKADVKRFVL